MNRIEKNIVDRVCGEFDRFYHHPSLCHFWIGGPVKMYGSRSFRKVGRKNSACIDICGIFIRHEKYRNRGLFSAILTHVEKTSNSTHAVRVDQILNPILIAMLKGRGYKTSRRNVDGFNAPSMYLPKTP